MNWPFVRRSKYLYLNQNYLDARSMFESYAQMNRENLIEINRLNQDLASELDSHKETKEELKETQKQRHSFFNEGQLLERVNKDLNKELRETKDALKIAQEDLRQHQMALSAADLRADKAKSEIAKIRGYLRKIAKDL